MKTLKLFHAVPVNAGYKAPGKPELIDGILIMPEALYAKQAILDFYRKNLLSAEDLNKSFHKSWKKIRKSSREELLIHQILHYLSTYGTDFTGEMYIPAEKLKIPKAKDLKLIVVRALPREVLIEKGLNMLRSGMALSEETVDDILSMLIDELDYEFTGKENIRNKEAVIKLADLYGIYPEDPVEFLRFIVYKSTGKTLLIKNKETVEAIRVSSFNPAVHFRRYGLEKLARIFNRFKPLFIAYKNKSRRTVNRISKLSKKYHEPFVENPVNRLTSRKLTDAERHWLQNASVFHLFKVYQALRRRAGDAEPVFLFKIRNGKSYVRETPVHAEAVAHNLPLVEAEIKRRLAHLKGKKIFLPANVEYALPVSEKMFAGPVPAGTKFFGKRLVVGIYWRNDWGARDLDLSALTEDGKVGWNALYNQDEGALMYSGDITDAPDGAVEYVYARKKLDKPALIMNNVFSGNVGCRYKIVIGEGDKIKKKYVMHPAKKYIEIDTQTVQR